MKYAQVKKYITLLILLLSQTKLTFSYVLFNRSQDPTEIISALVFKDEKSAIEFFEQLGWVQRVEDVTDKAALASFTIPITWLSMGIPQAITIGVTKIAEKAILDKYIKYEHNNLFTPAERNAKVKLIENEKDENIRFKTEDIKNQFQDLVKQQREIIKILETEKDNAAEKELLYQTGSAWWWKAIEDKHGQSMNNPFIVLVRIPPQPSGLPSTQELFQLLQSGIKYMRMQIVGSGYINRAAIANYKGTNTITMYLPFVEQRYTGKIKTDGIPAQDIQWLTLDQGKQKNLLLYEYMTGSNLATIENLVSTAPIDRGLSLFFKNQSDFPVHIFFVEQRNLVKIFEAGGWTKKSVEELFKITKTVAAIGADAISVAYQIPVSIKSITNIQFDLFQQIIGDFPEQAAQGIAVAAIKPKDNFANVFPNSMRYSYFADVNPGQGIIRPSTSLRSEFPRSRVSQTDLVVAIFPSDAKQQPDFSKPIFAGNFDRKEFNGVVFWERAGQINFVKFDPETRNITRNVIVFGVPVEQTKDSAQITDEGNVVLEGLINQAKQSTNPTIREHIAEAEKLKR